jgi:cytochrome c-type biogenesis protein CcmF
MELGDVLVDLSLGLTIVTIAISFFVVFMYRFNHIQNMKLISLISKIGAISVFLALTGALVLLYHYFWTSNMNIQYVWEYSSRSLAGEYKISAVLAGMSGSLLFWIWCIGLAWFVEELIELRKPKNSVLMAITRIIMMTISGVFLYFLTLRDLFGKTPQNLLNFAPDGNGLNPLLQTPLMIIHPPVVFLAYGFCVIALAASVSYLITNNKKWVDISISWSRWAWVFLTLGIGIGGLWAYVVLGWGGYWAWDPVETSSFLPWIILTAFLHAQLMNKRKGDYVYAAPALGIYTFVLVIFATFTTRAGGIWQSVHAFGSADVNQSAWQRFWEVTTSDGIILGYFLLMMIIAIGGAILLFVVLIMRRGVSEDISSYESKGVLEDVINDKVLMYVTLMVLTITTLVTLALLILSVNGADRTQFDSKVGLLTMVGVVILTLCLAWKHLGRLATLISLLLCGGTSLLLAILFIDNWIVASTMPFLILALGVTSLKMIKSIKTKDILILSILIIVSIVFFYLLILLFSGVPWILNITYVALIIIAGIVAGTAIVIFLLYGLYKTIYSLLIVSSISILLALLTGDNWVMFTGENWIVYFSLPYLILLIGGLGNKIRGTLNTLSPHIVHLGVVLLVMGFVGSNLLVSEEQITLTPNGTAQRVGDYEYRMVDGDFFAGESIFVTVEILKDGDKIGEGRPGAIFLEDSWRNEISVVGQAQEDIYLVFIDANVSGSTVTSVDMTVKTLPWMILLWIGMWLLAIGVIMRLIIVYFRPTKVKKEKRVEQRARMRESKETYDDYYEDLIERELREMG